MQTETTPETRKPFLLASSIMPKAPGTHAWRIVLHQAHADGELVVHHQNVIDGKPSDFYWGDYFRHAMTDTEAAQAAIECYLAKCKRYGLNPLAETGLE